MDCLKRFCSIFKKFFAKETESAAKQKDIFSPSELLSRFLYSTTHFSRQKKSVKSSGFMPNNFLRLSVFGIYQLTKNEIWGIGGNVSKKSLRTLYGRGDFEVSIVEENNLHLKLDDIQPRHADILGWPKYKPEQKIIALQLAEKAELHLFK